MIAIQIEFDNFMRSWKEFANLALEQLKNVVVCFFPTKDPSNINTRKVSNNVWTNNPYRIRGIHIIWMLLKVQILLSDCICSSCNTLNEMKKKNENENRKWKWICEWRGYAAMKRGSEIWTMNFHKRQKSRKQTKRSKSAR